MKSFVKRCAHALAWLLVGLGALLLAVLVHLDQPRTKRVVMSRVNALLATTLRGTIELRAIEHVGVAYAQGVAASVRDPEGRALLEVEGVSAQLRLGALLRGLPGEIHIELEDVHIERAHLVLEQDPGGELPIATTFLPRPRDTPPSSGPSTFYLVLDDATIAAARVENRLGLPVNADVRHLRASVRVDPQRVAVSLAHAGVRSEGLPSLGGGPAELDGFVAATLVLPMGAEPQLTLRATVGGTLGAVPFGAVAELEDMRLSTSLHVHDEDGARLRALIPSLPIEGGVDARVTGTGTIAKRAPSDPTPTLTFGAEVQAARARVIALAQLQLESTPRLALRAHTHDVDLSQLLAEGPPSALGAEVRAELVLGTPLHGDFAIDVAEGEIAEQPIPRAALQGDLMLVAGAALPRVRVQGTVYEPGAQTTLEASVEDGTNVQFLLQTAPIDLATQRRVPRGVARGVARADATGTLRLLGVAAPEIDATVRVQGSAVQSQGAGARSVLALARVEGPIAAPRVQTSVVAKDAHLPNGTTIARVDARATVGVVPSPTLRGVQVTLEPADSEPKLTVRADEIALGDGVQVRGVQVEGLGAPIEGGVSVQGGRLVIKLHTGDVDLEAVRRLIDREGAALPVRGRAHLDLDLIAQGRQLQGNAQIDLTQLRGLGLDDASVHVHGDFRGARSDLTLDARVPDAGTITLRARDIMPSGPVLAVSSWRDATFDVHVDANASLAAVHDRAPQLPLSQLAGQVALQLHAERTRAGELPTVTLDVNTEGLDVGAGYELRSRDLDLQIHAECTKDGLTLDARAVDGSGATGTSHGGNGSGVAGTSRAGSGTLVWVTLATPLPKTIPTQLEALADHPFDVQLYVPRRPLARLPALLQLGDLPGRVQLAAVLSGTLRDPRLALDFDARGLSTDLEETSAERRKARAARRAIERADTASSRPSNTTAPTLDVQLRARYDGQAARLTTMASSAGRNVLDAELLLEAKIHDLFSHGAGDPSRASLWERRWRAAARIAADELPLEWIPGLADRGVRGRLGGELIVDRFHDDARMKGAFVVKDLQTGRTDVSRARIELDAENGQAKALVRVDQGHGALSLTANTAIEWGSRAFFRPKERAPLRLALDANRFRIAALQPVLADVFHQLDGVLDADLAVELLPPERGAHPNADPAPKPKIVSKGQLRLSQGLVQAAAVGDELRDVAFRVTVSPDGVLALDDFVAHPTAGEIRGRGRARFDGITFEDAEATFSIPKQSALELAIAGLSLEEVYGDIELRAHTKAKSTRAESDATRSIVLDVAVPKLNVQLPGIPSSDVQALTRRPDVRVGTHTRGEFRSLPLDGSDRREKVVDDEGPVTPFELGLRLGTVTATVGNLAQVRVTGAPKLVVQGEQTNMSGQIQLQGGWLDLRGKKFDIESGAVTFNGDDPSNPTVVARAVWLAPDQTRVIAEYIGPVKTGKVELRSEPPLPKNEVMALLLFGSVSGASSDAGGQLGGALTNSLPDGLGQAITGITGLKTQARIDTSTRNPRPELEVQVSDTISIGFMTVLGTPPVSEPDRNYGKFSWRFAAHWSLVATIGSRYSTLLDAIWQYRY